jgi:uncharacterized metal-binding protein YceD (DUF177 family)
MSVPDIIPPELTRLVRAYPLGAQVVRIEANEAERDALAVRFGLAAVKELHAEASLAADGDAVLATGRLSAAVVQPCGVSGDDITVAIDEPVSLRFVRHARAIDPEEEAELPADEPDEIEFDGDAFDLGEAIAQTLGLAIDPYIVGPDAESVRQEVGIVSESAPKGALAEAFAALRKD